MWSQSYGKVDLLKQSGSWQGGIGATALSPGYEVNDLGFQSWADWIEMAASFGYRQPRVGPRLRSLSVTAEGRRTLNFGGDVVDAAAGLSLSAVHASFNRINANLTREFEVWDDRLTRGGSLTRRPAGYYGRIGISTDQRRDWQVQAGFAFAEDDGGGWRRQGDLNCWLRLLERIELSLGPRITRARTAAQYVRTITDPSATGMFGERHVFAPLDQTTFGIETELMVALNPRLTLEVYVQPFVSSGDYGGLMELARPRSFEFLRYGRDRGSLTGGAGGGFRVDPDGTGARVFDVEPLDFDFRSLIGNAVLRWEWRTGSTLFLVWQQTRSERLVGRASGDSDLGRFEIGPDTRALFGLRPDNVFMLKATYWLNP